jgi:hypothetical protein
MVIQLNKSSTPITESDDSKLSTIQERELIVRKEYTKRIELLLEAFLISNMDKEWSTHQECKRDFLEFIEESAFQFDEL